MIKRGGHCPRFPENSESTVLTLLSSTMDLLSIAPFVDAVTPAKMIVITKEDVPNNEDGGGSGGGVYCVVA